MSRKNIILTLFTLFAIFFSSCTNSQNTEKELQKIIASNNSNLSNGPLYIAVEEGYFFEEGLNVELYGVSRSAEAIAGMISGDIDVVSVGNGIGLLNTITHEEGIQVVADRAHLSKNTCTYYGVIIGKEYYESGEVTRPLDLLNYTIRSQSTGVSAFLFSLYLAEENLQLEDLDYTYFPSSSTNEALDKQTIAAATAVEPNLSKAINGGFGVLVAGMEDYVDDYQISVLAYGKKLNIENPELGVSFMKAYLKGVKQYNEGKTPRNLEIISSYIETSEEELMNTCWPSIWEDGHISYDSFLNYQEWSIENGDLDKIVPEEKFWNSYFTEEAYRLINN